MAETVAQHAVSAFATPANGAALSADVVRTNLNTLQAAYTAHDADPGIHLQYSVLASRPAAGTSGRKWLTLDPDGRLQLWHDNGAAWVEATGLPFASTDGQPALYDAGNSGTGIAIDWENGPVQKVTLTGNATLTFTNPVSGGTFTLILVQDGTGGRTVSLTGWDFGDSTPSYNTAASKKNVVSGLYDGAEYLGALSVVGA
jgi:hypothetical protein